MPSLVAFGRRWSIASDDFVFPGITEGLLRLVWTAFCVAVFVYHYPITCTKKDLSSPVIVLLVINAVTLIISFALAAVSSRGTIMITRPRRHVANLLYLRISVLILELAWTIFATISIFERHVDSSCQVSIMIKATIVLEWLLFVFAVAGMCIVFHPKHEDGVEDRSLISRRIWTRRFKLFKIRQDALMRAALDDLANLFASFFQSSDIVFSDVVAGLLLVVHSPTNAYPPLTTCSLDRPSWMTEKNALHFLHFAAAVYGWPTYLFENFGCSSFVKLWRRMQCCGRLRCDQKAIRCLYDARKGGDGSGKDISFIPSARGRPKVLVVEDNCCFCNTAAFALSTEDKNIDLFFVSFRNRLYEVPFVVLADHESKSVVVTIRGSWSISDLITDLCLEDEVLSVDVDTDPTLRSDPTLDSATGEPVRVHRGMLHSARFIFDTLRKNNTLEDMFVLNPSYSLVVCGHSLGAGVASLLTLFLKQQYPDVRCFGYAPPGCVVSEEGIPEMERHVMSVVCGDDVVSRISYQAMDRMREKVEAELRGCQRPKYEILLKGAFRLIFSSPWDNPLSGEDGAEQRSTGNGSDRSELIRPSDGRSEYGSSSLSVSTAVGDRVQLYAPGKILYISAEEGKHVKEWIDPRCLSDIKLSASSVTDHLPKNVRKTLLAVADPSSTSPISVV